MLADTDFILALVKESDWLKGNATKILDKYKNEIKTSISVMIELALLCKKLEMDALKTFVNTLEFINIDEENYAVCLRAALYIEKYGLNVFDSFHAAFCLNEKIISSDRVYDQVGIERVRLEEN